MDPEGCMSHWWRAHDDAIDNPKLLLLSDRGHRAWFNLCCLTSANGGNLPDLKVILVKIRMSAAKFEAVLRELREADLIEEDEHGMRPHDWNGRQFKSDVSTERVQRFRKRPRNVSSTVSETPPDTDNRNREDSAPSGATTPGKVYAFEDGVIRLTPKDFNKWKSAFEHIDLAAELLSLSKWAGEQADWFHAVKGALASKNRKAKAAAEAVARNGQLLTPDGQPWPEGIT
jgi:hypothetical protein